MQHLIAGTLPALLKDYRRRWRWRRFIVIIAFIIVVIVVITFVVIVVAASFVAAAFVVIVAFRGWIFGRRGWILRWRRGWKHQVLNRLGLNHRGPFGSQFGCGNQLRFIKEHANSP